MKCLYLFYDERCEVCRRLKAWLSAQAAWIELRMVAAGSTTAKTLFPDLVKVAGQSDLAVVSDAGEVYLNNHAWIMALYALEEYREWALRLASPVLLPLARQAWEMLSRNRAVVSGWMGSKEEDMAAELRSMRVKQCEAGECCGTGLGDDNGTLRGERNLMENTVRDYLQ